MSKPKFGEWRVAGVAPCCEHLLVRDEQGSHGIAIRAYSDNWSYYFGGGKPTHWMPLPDPPKKEWEEAWNKWICTPGNGYGGEHKAFEAGFEAGRNK